MTKMIGLIVNPIAGMGGSVGLKGTDGEMIERARELGAEPVTPERTQAFLDHLATQEEIRWLIAPGPMGACHVSNETMDFEVFGELKTDGTTTSADDTRRIARQMQAAGIDLLVFVGGDGTARDVHDSLDAETPVVGVPGGVKVYSGAFALSPRAAAEMVGAFVAGADVTEAEVLDIDEAAFREDRLEAQPYGYLLVPNVQARLQPGKEGTRTTPDTVENKQDIAADIVERMDADTLYLLGPGTTMKAITDWLDIGKTLLGIDAVQSGQVVGADLNEEKILELLSAQPQREIIVTPLGGSGFIFGRGNKPFTPKVLRRVGREHITVVATEQKMRQIEVLRVDTGDPELDAQLNGYMQVVIGYGLSRVVKVQAE